MHNKDTNISLLIESNTQCNNPVDKANILDNYYCEQTSIKVTCTSGPIFEKKKLSGTPYFLLKKIDHQIDNKHIK